MRITRRLPPVAEEIAPLAVRLRWMQLFRLVAAALVIGSRLALPDLIGGDLGTLAAATAAYAVLVGACSALWRMWPSRGRAWIGALALADGAFVAWITYTTGGPGAPLSYLAVIQLVMVTLLASYRSGLKIALW